MRLVSGTPAAAGGVPRGAGEVQCGESRGECGGGESLVHLIVDAETTSAGTCQSHWDFGGPSCDVLGFDCTFLESAYGFDCSCPKCLDGD